MKKLIWFVVAGAFIGGFLSSMFSPRVIGWYFEPPVDIGINCRAATEWAMARFQWAQLGGTVIGVIAALLIYTWIFSKRKPPNSLKL
ncbi:MAG: hypothetical protein JWQ35_15 [Bacteriovoracaceae bacterium]|nr:hypothetical protein [Bacteriovoracaceae bacterium]